MIIDLILDRKEGTPYNPKQFYNWVVGYGKIGDEISRAMDNGTEQDIKRELSRYIIEQEYRPSICDYINSVAWLTE